MSHTSVPAGRCRITYLCENRAGVPGLMGEWGLAVLVETASSTVLLDTGWGFALGHNARELGVDLAAIDAIGLSHGHLDHTGALHTLLEDRPDLPVFMHEACLAERFAKHGAAGLESIGIPERPRQALLAASGKRLVTEPAEMAPGIWISGPIPRMTPEEGSGGIGFLDKAAHQPDLIEDDLSFWVETAEGLVVLLGCAHAGAVNILKHILEVTGNRPIYAVLGGMHLMGVSRARMDVTIATLRALGPRLIGPCHCTGLTETFALRQALPDRFVEISAGTRLDLPLVDAASA